MEVGVRLLLLARLKPLDPMRRPVRVEETLRMLRTQWVPRLKMRKIIG